MVVLECFVDGRHLTTVQVSQSGARRAGAPSHGGFCVSCSECLLGSVASTPRRFNFWVQCWHQYSENLVGVSCRLMASSSLPRLALLPIACQQVSEAPGGGATCNACLQAAAMQME